MNAKIGAFTLCQTLFCSVFFWVYLKVNVLPLRTRRQTTIAKSATVTGFGLWSGKDICLEFRPAEPNSGIVFVRSDLGPDARVPARVEHRIESPRRTTLSANGVSVEMVEHVMAALAGLRIDNCEIHVDAPEMPGMDGSSLAFLYSPDFLCIDV